jgi:hypothetical protein
MTQFSASENELKIILNFLFLQVITVYKDWIQMNVQVTFLSNKQYLFSKDTVYFELISFCFNCLVKKHLQQIVSLKISFTSKRFYKQTNR